MWENPKGGAVGHGYNHGYNFNHGKLNGRWEMFRPFPGPDVSNCTPSRPKDPETHGDQLESGLMGSWARSLFYTFAAPPVMHVG